MSPSSSAVVNLTTISPTETPASSVNAGVADVPKLRVRAAFSGAEISKSSDCGPLLPALQPVFVKIVTFIELDPTLNPATDIPDKAEYSTALLVVT